MNSTHKIEVIEIKLQKHPDPLVEKLSIVDVGGDICVTQTAQWSGTNMLAAWIPPDNLVDVSRPQFSFLFADAKPKYNGMARIKAKKIRGVSSFGLLVPAPEGSKIGDDVTNILGVVPYIEPEEEAIIPGTKIKIKGVSESEKPPQEGIEKYELEGKKLASTLLIDGELVVCTEKIHGQQYRVVYKDGKLHVGSKDTWKRKEKNYKQITPESLREKNPEITDERVEEIMARINSMEGINEWWDTLIKHHPEIIKFCEENEGYILYGEHYGRVQKGFKYDAPEGENRIRIFDVAKLEKDEVKFLDYEDAIKMLDPYGIKTVPLVAMINYNHNLCLALAEGKTLLGGKHIREGIVVKPVKERRVMVGRENMRCIVKYVSLAYLERD